MIAHFKFKPFTKCLIYGFIPTRIRAISANLIAAVWGVIYSWIVHNNWQFNNNSSGMDYR